MLTLLHIGDMFFYPTFNTFSQFRYLFFLQGQTGSIGVSAKVLDDVTTGIDGRIYVETLDGTCRTAGKAQSRSEHDGRTIIMLSQSAGNDSDHTLVPRGIIDEDGLLVLDVHLVNHLNRLLGDTLVKFLTRFVVFRNAFGTFVGSSEVTGNKQIDGLLAVHHSTRGIDARTNLEDDVRIGQFLLVLEAA